MFRFLMGVAFGAAGYWAWQSFGRDLLGLGNDQDTTYGGFNSGTTGTTTYGGGTSSSTTAGTGSATPTSSGTSSTSSESPTSGT